MTGTVMTSIGERVRTLRERAEMSQQELASKAGLSVSIVSQLERGRSADPRISTLRGLAKALNVSVHELINDREAGTNEEE